MKRLFLILSAFLFLSSVSHPGDTIDVVETPTIEVVQPVEQVASVEVEVPSVVTVPADPDTQVMSEVVIYLTATDTTPKPPILPAIDHSKYHLDAYIHDEMYVDEDRTFVNRFQIGWSMNRSRLFVHNILVQRHSRTGFGIGYYGKNWDFEIDTMGIGYLYYYLGNDLDITFARDVIDSEIGFRERIMDNRLSMSQTIEIPHGQFVTILEHSWISDGNSRDRFRFMHLGRWSERWSTDTKYMATWYDRTVAEYYSPNFTQVIQSITYYNPYDSRYSYGIGPSYRVEDSALGLMLAIKHRSKKDAVKAIVEINDTNYFYLYLHWKF